MVMGVWTRSGSEKAQSSQTIRILLRSLQYLAEDLSQDENKFLNVTVPIISNLFTPIQTSSMNEQVSKLFESFGWKNVQIKLTAANKASIILGSNRHLEQNEESLEGLKLLVKAISTGVGKHLLGMDVDARINVNLSTGAVYNIDLTTISKREDTVTPKSVKTEKPMVKAKEETRKVSSQPIPAQVSSSSSEKDLESAIDATQLFLPVLNSKLPLSTVFLMLQDVLVEFCKSWYQLNPLDNFGSEDQRENVVKLVLFLIEKTTEADRDTKTVGNQVGRFFAQELLNTFEAEFESIITPEILESNANIIVRDIKARSLCNLNPGDKCVQSNRAVCDFGMGIYEGILSTVTDKITEFTTYFAAGRRDIYCLMEFQVEN
jgi:hypothetical protein